MDEGSPRQHVEEIAEHDGHLRLGLRGTHEAVGAAPRGREVVGADRASLGVALAQELDRHQGVERVLELPSAREGPVEAARQAQHPRLVVHHLVGAVDQPVDAVDAAAEAEA